MSRVLLFFILFLGLSSVIQANPLYPEYERRYPHDKSYAREQADKEYTRREREFNEQGLEREEGRSRDEFSTDHHENTLPHSIEGTEPGLYGFPVEREE